MIKQNQLSIIITVIIIISLAIISNNFRKGQKPIEKLSKQKASIERDLHDYYMMRDPNTDQVETSRLVKARQIAQKKLNSSNYFKNAIAGVSWEERGPTNVSGRTRAILIDKNDNTGNTVFAGGVAGGLWRTTDGGTTWTPIDDFFANLAVTAIAQDPNDHNIIYFGTGEGFSNADAVRGLGIWKSTNGGNTFSQLAATNNNNSFDFINKLVVLDVGNSNSYVFAATRSRFCNRGGIMRSKNAGTTWTEVTEGNGTDCASVSWTNDYATDIEIASNGDLYAAFGQSRENDGIYKSTDNGDTWSRVFASPANQIRIELACAPSSSGTVYAAIENDTLGGVPRLIKTTNNGTTWTDLGAINWVGDDQIFPACQTGNADWTRNQDWYDMILGVDPNNANTVYLGGIDLFKSSNGGISWNMISSWWGGCGQYVHADQHAMVFNNSSEIWFGNDGGVYKTINGTASIPTITFRGNGFNVTQYYSADLHPTSGSNVMLGGAQDNGSHRLTSPGLNVATEVSGGDGSFCHIDQNNGAVQISSYIYNDYFITENNWNSLTRVRTSSSASAGRFINPTDYDDSANILYGSDHPDHYSRITLTGKIYDQVDVTDFPGTFGTSPSGTYSASTVKVSPNVANRVYFGFANGTVYYVDDAHSGTPNATTKSATKLFDENLSIGVYVSCIEIEEGNENHMLITMSNYGITSVYESTNASSSNPLWIAVEGDLPDMPVRWASFNPNNADQAFLATELGVWSTSNLNGTSTLWMPTNTGLANTRIDMIKFRSSDQKMIVASHGRGIFTSVDAGGCDHQLLTLTNFVDNTVYDDADVIESSVSMDKNNVTFRAESSVELKIGFSVADNKVFTAEIGDCPD